MGREYGERMLEVLDIMWASEEFAVARGRCEAQSFDVVTMIEMRADR